MPTSIYEIENPLAQGLIIIPENKDREPLEKELILNAPPWVGVVPYGPRAGEHCINIKLSYSPLEGFPYDSGDWRDNERSPRMAIGELIKYCSNKAPRLVYITGGEPMYKWDDEVKWLCEELKRAEKEVYVESCGVIFPDVYEELYVARKHATVDSEEKTLEWLKIMHNTHRQIADHTTIKPQIFDAVPEEESGGYGQHLRQTLRTWRDCDHCYINWHFDIDMSQNEEMITLDLVRILTFMRELFEDKGEKFWGQTIVFVPKAISCDSETGHIDDYRRLSKEMGRYLDNLPGANIQIQINHAHI
jgi:organic radical activating enzyme